ncbi:unnamed protein product [Paramecium octaurelia]|uniref:NADH dehydrogenase [ubiquinone] 1 alpha subcomplex subunit 12 n=1 Tax=Paramecium octaurelia TaxID=43137 RepID=A0A8S1V5K8_PAROT|nr:unnamed protein product [Paramecium octaurelia]
MGLWAWTLNQMLTPKFWTLVRREGFWQTYIRMHRAQSRSSHYAGGQNGPIQCVGQDQFGNKYYEDFDVTHRNQRRWVEYNDYFNPWHTLGDRVPPVWHGWMAHVYDEAPTRTGHSHFVQPFYQQPATDNQSHTPNHYFPQGAMQSLNRLEFIKYHRNRRAAPFEPGQVSGFEGKKLVVEKQTYSEDVMASRE